MSRFKGKTAIVTGAGSGIGRASAIKLASEGAAVLVSDIREPGAKETVDLIGQAGGKASVNLCDVSNESQVKAMTAQAIDEFGGLDVLVANAGILTMARIHELSLSDWQRVIDVQLTGTFLCCREALRHMVDHGGGSIVTIGSVSSVVIGAGGSAASYKAAKAGVLNFTKAVAVEYAHQNIRANCVCPGLVKTNIARHMGQEAEGWTLEGDDKPRAYKITVPIERPSEPEDVANAVAFLASDEASMITGTSLMVDGGYTAV